MIELLETALGVLREQGVSIAHHLVFQSNADGLAFWRWQAEVRTEITLFSVASRAMSDLKDYKS